VCCPQHIICLILQNIYLKFFTFVALFPIQFLFLNCVFLYRLDERKRRKEFILERNLLFPNPLEKDLTKEDKEVYHRYKIFMRFLSKEEHEALVRSVIEERKIRRRIQELQVLFSTPP
jgi:hypothetical protein